MRCDSRVSVKSVVMVVVEEGGFGLGGRQSVEEDQEFGARRRPNSGK